MTRQQRRAINRANAAHSTGPVTVQGKETSSRNAIKHGLTSMKAYLPAEEQAYLAEMDRYLDMYDPQTEDEQAAVERLVDVSWRLLRIPALEARLFENPDADPFKVIRALDTLSRHEGRLRKLAKVTVERLLAMQQQREMLDAQDLQRERIAQAHNGLQSPPNPSGFVSQNPDRLQSPAGVTSSAIADSVLQPESATQLPGISRTKAA